MRATLPPAFAPRSRPGTLLLALVAWVGLTIVVSSLLAPAAWALVEAIAPDRFPFQRVFRRVAMLAALVVLIVGARRLGIRSLADCGLGLARDRLRAAGWAAAIGVVAIAALFAVELGVGTRVAGGRLGAVDALEALIGASLIGLLEEGLCRGALLFPFGALTGGAAWLTNGAVSAIYATAHFARGAGRPGPVDWRSGWEIWADLPVTAAAHVEAWLGLFMTGALFWVVARRQGHVWGAAGLHAGAVLALQVGGALSDPARGNDSLLLVDGLLPGYGIAVAAAVAIAILALRPPRAAALSPATPSTAPDRSSTAR